MLIKKIDNKKLLDKALKLVPQDTFYLSSGKKEKVWTYISTLMEYGVAYSLSVLHEQSGRLFTPTSEIKEVSKSDFIKLQEEGRDIIGIKDGDTLEGIRDLVSIDVKTQHRAKKYGAVNIETSKLIKGKWSPGWVYTNACGNLAYVVENDVYLLTSKTAKEYALAHKDEAVENGNAAQGDDKAFMHSTKKTVKMPLEELTRLSYRHFKMHPTILQHLKDNIHQAVLWSGGESETVKNYTWLTDTCIEESRKYYEESI